MAKPLVSEELWEVTAPLLPPPRHDKQKAGRQRVPDRAALAGIIFALKSGIPWEYLPQEMACGSGMTCWRRLRDWHAAGAWHRPHTTLLTALAKPMRLTGRVRASTARWCRPKGGARATAADEDIGPNPTDRGKPGSKRHPLVDRAGIPPAVWLRAANVNEGTPLGDLVDAVEPIRRPRGRPVRPRRRPAKLHADKAYSSRANRRA